MSSFPPPAEPSLLLQPEITGLTPSGPQPEATRTSRKPKIAFLFLTHSESNHSRIWKEYLSGHEESWNVYVHAKVPSAVECSLFRDRMHKDPVLTQWGDISLVRATLRLLAEAFAEAGNTHFVLLSESCVPVRSFPSLLQELHENSRSFLYWQHPREFSVDDVSKYRRAGFAHESVRKYFILHPQWWLFEREAVAIILRRDLTRHFTKVFAADESYFGTVLAFHKYDFHSRISRRQVTFTEWHGGTSPRAFYRVDEAIVHAIRQSGAFFARKFPRESDIHRFQLHMMP